MTVPRRTGAAAVILGCHVVAAPAGGQPAPNYALPPQEVEARLATAPFTVVAMADNRWHGDRTQRALLRFRDGQELDVKWARAVPGGFAINNQPRYEVAAFELQKLFLDPPDWVVPPTVMRALHLGAYRRLDPRVAPTFEGTGSVVVALQYWLEDVEAVDGPDLERAARDPDYAHRLEQLNLLTFLVRHADSNPGNVLVSTAGEPRLFAVDNGVAFRSPAAPRGTVWMDLHVRRLPEPVVARLRRLGRADLEEALYVVGQFEVGPGGRLQAVPRTPRLDPRRGVRRQGDVIQFGLTDLELDGLWSRLETLLARVDAGEIETY
jgi:hypothetical protein